MQVLTAPDTAAALPPPPPKFDPTRSTPRIGDKVYRLILLLSGLSVFAIIIGLGFELASGSGQSLKEFGFGFFKNSDWNPGDRIFGALPFILGTLYSSFWALLMAVPVSLLTAIFLAEILPAKFRASLSFLVELLASIPSVVYGLWGLFVLRPWLVEHFEKPISNGPLSALPIFGKNANGYDMLTASVILAIMITPYITAVSRDILKAIPRAAREGSYALGATRWETIRGVVLPYARAGFIGAVILGFGRALGETMAVTMVIGNLPAFNLDLFHSGYTMSSVIANEMAEASGLYRSALIEVGLTLFLVTMVVNMIARLLVYYTAQDIQGGGRRA